MFKTTTARSSRITERMVYLIQKASASHAERDRSAAGGAGEPLNLEKPSCPAGLLQRIVRPSTPASGRRRTQLRHPLLYTPRAADLRFYLRSFFGGNHMTALMRLSLSLRTLETDLTRIPMPS